MINKDKENNQKTQKPAENSGFKDVAHMDVQCHVLIKDKDTGKILVNKRG